MKLINKNRVYLLILVGVILLAGVYLVNSYKTVFNTEIFDVDRVYNHIAELTSPKYEGRLAGSEGNRLALKYIEDYFRQIGIEPAGENNTYYQQLKSMVPVYASKPSFRVTDNQGNVVGEFEIGRDFLEDLSGFGSGGNVKAELMYLNKNVTSYPDSEIKDKIIVFGGFGEKDKEYAIDHGVKGIITAAYGGIGFNKSPVALETKKGKAVLSLMMEKKAFNTLAKLAQRGLKAEIKLDTPYQVLETPNILGKIEGKKKDEYIIISSHVDGVGTAYHKQFYFPGALDGASGIGTMLELAKVIKEQSIKPEKTIIFAAWNNQEFGLKGSTYYAEHPLYPLAKSQVIVLNDLGGKTIADIVVDSSGDAGIALANQLLEFSRSNANIEGRINYSGRGDDHQPFLAKNVPAALYMGNLYNKWYSSQYGIHSYIDDINYIDKNTLKAQTKGLLSYIREDIFGDSFPRYLSKVEVGLVITYLLGVLVIYTVFQLNKLNPKVKFLNLRLEDIYYSIPFSVLQRLFYYITPALFIILALIFIANVPKDFSLTFVNGESYSNFSFYLTLKKSVLYIRNLFVVGLGTTKSNMSIMEVLPKAFLRSSGLLLSSITFAFLFGIAKGIRDGFSSKGKGDLRTVGTLMVLSLPDVFIVIVIQVLLIYLHNHNLLDWFFRAETVRRFVVPFISLSILPTVYISRLTATAVREEINKDYIKSAKARGMSNFAIIRNHLLIAVVIKVVDTLGSVMAGMISNLIVIEFLTFYPGVVYGLMKFYQEGDTAPFISYALSLGLMYVSFVFIFRLAAKLVNPLKREGA